MKNIIFLATLAVLIFCPAHQLRAQGVFDSYAGYYYNLFFDNLQRQFESRMDQREIKEDVREIQRKRIYDLYLQVDGYVTDVLYRDIDRNLNPKNFDLDRDDSLDRLFYFRNREINKIKKYAQELESPGSTMETSRSFGIRDLINKMDSQTSVPLTWKEVNTIKKMAKENISGNAGANYDLASFIDLDNLPQNSIYLNEGSVEAQMDQLLTVLSFNGKQIQELVKSSKIAENYENDKGSFIVIAQSENFDPGNSSKTVIVNDVYYQAVSRFSKAYPDVRFLKANELERYALPE
ncbi:hypothetical protein C4569_03705 [Candidatus Parcubacteria bacterium]|nr:MAG: hypothetical protein C4569_03705 [Candidatus Parcubacteria bacterium]